MHPFLCATSGRQTPRRFREYLDQKMVKLLLRDTQAYSEWLSQFDHTDRRWASLLTDSLELIPTRAFQADLAELVRRQGERSPRTVALFAIREPNVPSLPPGERQTGNTSTTLLPYFDPTDTKRRPDAVAGGAGVGSEGIMANLLRDVATDSGPGRFLDHPSIDMMRASKCDDIFLVDDIVGSGQRVTTFMEAFCMDKHLRSWLSYGYVRITVLAYAATQLGEAEARGFPGVCNVVCVRRSDSGRKWWRDSERVAIESVCCRYAYRTSRPKMPLGFGNAFTCTVFEHKCPNTAPAIFWAGRKRTWLPLFRSKPGFGFSVWPAVADEEQRGTRLLQGIGQTRLARGAWAKFLKPRARLTLLVLAAVAKGERDSRAISGLVEANVKVVEQLLAECKALAWVTPQQTVTEKGIAELGHARRLQADAEEPAPMKSSFYFPRSLRVARGPSSAGRHPC